MIIYKTIFLSIIVLVAQPCYSLAGVACDFGKTPISLKVLNQPVTEIIKEIDKQTQFTIALKNEIAVTSTKSIELKETPLDQTFKRLLKKINYSLICDGEQNKLTVVFLDQGKKSTGFNHTPPSSSPEDIDEEEIQELMDKVDDDFSPPPAPSVKRLKPKPALPINTIPPVTKRTPEEVARIKAAIEKHRSKLPENQ